MEVARDQIQEATPWSTEGSDGLQRDAFDIHGIAPWLLPGAPDKNLANSALKPRPGRFEFLARTVPLDRFAGRNRPQSGAGLPGQVCELCNCYSG